MFLTVVSLQSTWFAPAALCIASHHVISFLMNSFLQYDIVMATRAASEILAGVFTFVFS